MGKDKESTKDLFLIEALRLFAEKGYDAVSVSEIAEAVGCSAPALYKHYPNKQALFDGLVKMSRKVFSEQMDRLLVDFCVDREKRKEFVLMPEKMQVEVIKQLFLHMFDGELPGLFRKFMTIEAFQRREFAALLNRQYVDSQFYVFETLMQEFISSGIYRDGNARAMAVQYASPIILYISVCDREPDRKEEALMAIGEHIKQFNMSYRIK